MTMFTARSAFISGLLSVLFAVLLFAGCGSKRENTPRKVFRTYQKAVKQKDAEKLLGLIPEKDQAIFIGSLYFSVGMPEMLPNQNRENESALLEDLRSIEEKHGIRKRRKNLLSSSNTNHQNMRETFETLMKDVDETAFMNDLFQLMEKHNRKNPYKTYEGTIQSIEQNGDRAVINVRTGKQIKEIHTIKNNGRWYLDYERITGRNSDDG